VRDLSGLALLPRRLRLAIGRAKRRGALPQGLNHWQEIEFLHEELYASQGSRMRSNYVWSVLHSARVARALAIPRISVLEFGVAGGNGLAALEEAAEYARSTIGTAVDVYGFDTGVGLPPAVDHRDTPYVHQPGDFPMNEAALRARLKHATLVLGLIKDTLGEFIASSPAPVGFISFDVDYYSSTVDAFSVLEGDPSVLMPRVMCYFDDVLGYPWGDLNGERLAIAEFNEAHEQRKIAQLYGLRYMLPGSQRNASWPEAMCVAHVLDHPRYLEDEGVTISTRLDLAG
jgi:hypothetical protein